MEHIITVTITGDPEAKNTLNETEKVLEKAQKVIEDIKTNGAKECFARVEIQYIPEDVKTRSL